MRFLHPQRDAQLELSLDDVFLLPQLHPGGSRLDVDLTPPDRPGSSQPLVSANMNAVTGKRMAETMARYGGLGVLPQDMAIRTVERIVRHVKQAPLRCDTALTISPDATLRDVRGILYKRAHGMVVVVDDDQHPMGLVTASDMRDVDQYTPVSQVMSRRPVTVSQARSHAATFDLMDERRLKAVPIVDGDGRLRGVLTRDDAVRFALFTPSLGAAGRLMVSAAVGISSDAAERAAALKDMGVDVIVLDTAHGHQRRMLEAIAEVRDATGPSHTLVAGNVCTAEGTRALIEAGADIVKVNVGPGAMCTTRMKTGVGRPTFTAALACAEEAKRHGRFIWADGGVRNPRDVALYLAAGAARVMLGTILAGTYESPGEMKTDEHGRYKENYGMASARAVRDRSADLRPFEQAKKALFREGISTSRVYLKPGLESVGATVTEIVTGVQSAFTYVGARDCESFAETAIVGVQSPAGYTEGKPRPVY
ncbi:MAG: GuaB1 family IMP dehydrogenase-related protein [Myxococcota bacterium]